MSYSTGDAVNLGHLMDLGSRVKDELDDRSKDVTLTQAEYNALVEAGTVDPDTVYYISDAPAIPITHLIALVINFAGSTQ